MDQVVEIKGAVAKSFQKFLDLEAQVEVAEAAVEAAKDKKSEAVAELVRTCGSKKFKKGETLFEIRQRGETYFVVRKPLK